MWYNQRMPRITAHLSYANAMSSIAVFMVLGGGAYAAVSSIPGPGGVIQGCYQKNKGTLRVIKPGQKCAKSSEVALSWNQKGVPGAPGAAGAVGATGAAGAAGAAGGAGSQGSPG